MVARKGGGKYGSVVERVRKETEAALTIVIVAGGNEGTGFSVAARDESFISHIPELLESMASSIRKEIEEGENV